MRNFVLKVRCAGTPALEQLVSDRLECLARAVCTRTTIVVFTVKDTVVPPLPGGAR